MLKEYNREAIDAWESKLLAAAAEMRKIRLKMEDAGVESVRLEATRASDLIDYLAGWAITAEAKARQDMARASATKKLAEVAGRPRKS